jgi:branched-chain amino acid transport system permease protein
VYFTIFTFGLVELLKNLVLWYDITFNHTRGRAVVRADNTLVLICMAALFVLLVAGYWLSARSRLGRALSAIGESEDAAAHIGINTTLVKVTAFAVSAFAVGAAGAASAPRWGYIDPQIAFNSLYSFMPVLMALFGGVAAKNLALRVAGPVVGAVVFTLLEEQLITKFPSLYMIIFVGVMVVAILFLPRGIIGLAETGANRLFRKKGGGA